MGGEECRCRGGGERGDGLKDGCMKEKMDEEKGISGRKRWRDLHPSATITLWSAAKNNIHNSATLFAPFLNATLGRD